jgi:hypothetical protein
VAIHISFPFHSSEYKLEDCFKKEDNDWKMLDVCSPRPEVKPDDQLMQGYQRMRGNQLMPTDQLMRDGQTIPGNQLTPDDNPLASEAQLTPLDLLTLEQLARAFCDTHSSKMAGNWGGAADQLTAESTTNQHRHHEETPLYHRLDPELLFAREEDAVLNHLHNFHIMAIKSACRHTIYQVHLHAFG